MLHCTLKVCIKLAALVSLDVVHELVKSQTTGTVDTASAMQAIDVVLSSMPSMRYYCTLSSL